MRVSEREIAADDFFSKDKLCREKEVKVLSKMIKNAIGPYVISIDAPWGTGKTYFTKLLKANLDSDTQTIYINAWENDYNTDPSVSIISELKAIVSEDKLEKITDKFFKFSKIVMPAAIKVASHGLIDPDKIADAVSSIGQSYIMQRIEHYQEEKNAIEDLRDSLAESAREAKGNKIVVFIDELDRCRPSYAIDFLERVKHFFEVEGFIFVLSIDESQLLNSIKVNYGQSFDSEKYLRRFIDFKFSLKPDIHKEFISDSFSRIGLDKYFLEAKSLGKSKLDYVQVMIKYLADLNELTARDINQIISKINIRLISREEGSNIAFFELQLIFIILKHLNKELYQKYISRSVTADEVISLLGLYDDKFDEYGSYKTVNSYITGIILLQLRGQSLNSNLLNDLIKLRDSTANESNKKMRDYAVRVLRVLGDYDVHIFDFVVKQFEQTDY
ncbi:MAG: P-loop NTPase fold protein [Balneola sp.]